MLSRRLISAAIIVSFMVTVVWADYHLPGWGLPLPGLLLMIVTWAAQMIATGELIEMWKRDGRSVSFFVALVGVTVMFVGASLPIIAPKPLGDCSLGLFGGVFLGLFGALCVASVYEIVQYDPANKAFDRMAHHLFAIVYMAMLAGGVAFHRRLFEDNGFGLCSAIAVIATVKMSDATAYGFGKAFGKHKLSPKISSGKTIEGALGAFVGGIAGAAIVFYLVAPQVAGNVHERSWLWIIGYGITLTIAGMIGDLAESIIKRDAHCKDSSVWVPGLGGILDILDSLIFAVPASCIYWIMTT
ncbi:MAG: phosphatidate cytidylyltransferase [Pirellulaceae bacterium]